MKNMFFAVTALLLCTVTTFSTLAVKIGADKPDTMALGYRWGTVDSSTHRVTFDSAVSPGCNTPLHTGTLWPTHSHGDFQTMHYCWTTSGNWWNGAKTIWQLKRTWCGCEGFGALNCGGGGPNRIKAFCTYV
ncbi:MAG: hypothetical protein IT442_01820 [Phycisphaeraceae bacterium]|nr:hypothetical protein [Phycisphaeraceae bacterium]